MNGIWKWSICLGVLLVAGVVWAQGPLVPSEAPAPVMKTLTQVEPRIPISSLPYTISSGGSYYLTTNLTGSSGFDGITITADNVFLDLNGFILLGVPGSQDGITMRDLDINYNISVHNGCIREWGGSGVKLLNADNSSVSGLLIYSNDEAGVMVGYNSVIKDCNSMYNGEMGLYAYNGSTIRECSARQNGTDGICVYEACRVLDNLCNNNGLTTTGAGVRARTTKNVIRNNSLMDNATGIQLDGAGNFIAENVVLGNTENYALGTNNQIEILLSELPETIAWPARVELAGSLSGIAGLLIDSDDVTVDLKGHALVGLFGAQYGIHATNDFYNVTVCNGVIRDWDNAGIGLNQIDNCNLSDLQVMDITGVGIQVGHNAVITRCVVTRAAEEGIYCGQASVVSECSASDNTQSGFNIGWGSVIKDCTARLNDMDGFRIGMYCNITGCTASENGDNGILVGDGSQIIENNCVWNTEAGIRTDGGRCRIDGNTVTLNNDGIDVNGVQNIVVRNMASGNSVSDYAISGGNSLGAIDTVAGANFTNCNAWGNLSF
jgi:parallel beta-helix repeat protein